MTANILPKIFTIEIGDTPTLTFEVQNLREAQELCHEQWLKDDLAEAKSDGVPLWDGKAKLRARIALPDESALFAEANKNKDRQTERRHSVGNGYIDLSDRSYAYCFLE